MSATVPINCPNCRARLRLSLEVVGKALRCAKCSHLFRTKLRKPANGVKTGAVDAESLEIPPSKLAAAGGQGVAAAGSPTQGVAQPGGAAARPSPPSSQAQPAVQPGIQPAVPSAAPPAPSSAAVTAVRKPSSGATFAAPPAPLSAPPPPPPPPPPPTPPRPVITTGNSGRLLPGRRPYELPPVPPGVVSVPPPPGAAAASANARTTYAARVVDDSQEGDTGSADPLEGKRLGQYWLLKRLGRGAKGIVYLADDELLGRQVAVKVLSPELSAGDPISVQRFLLEARATSQISHANVISVYSVGRQDFGKESYIYIAMALVTGGSVLERLDAEGVYSPAEATRIVRQAALGLHAAHQLGIVHRDVKPANLLLGDNGEVKVADFGMAKMVDNSYSNLTEPGTLMGTPHYMSPEQCLGGAIDHRADIYSLGATYFRLLTGQTPFADMSPLAVAHKQVNDPHPDPRTVNPAVPGICVRIIDRALAKNPADRYQTAAEMAAALQVVETSLRQSEQMQEEAERPADRRGETIVVSERELADILNDSFGDDSETDSDSLRDVEPPPPAPSPSASRMFPKAALPQPAPMPSPRPAAPPPLLAPAPPRNGAASVTRMPAAPMPPPSGAFRTAPPYTPPAPGLPASHGRGGATEPSWMSLPVKAAFKLRYNTVEDVKKALGFLRKDVRDIARKVIAPTLVKGAKAAVLDITVCLSPTEHFGVIKTLVAAGGAFMGMECEDAEFQNWFRRQVSTLRPPR